jgi:O-6-methylguanine DNA methyltransferase
MKEQTLTVVLPPLPIVGQLRLRSRDGVTLSGIEVVAEPTAPDARSPFFETCYRRLQAYLTGEVRELDVPVDLEGLTPFQRRVLREMIAVPRGTIATYKDLADRLGTRGYQAIGTACGKNPLMLVYPCHRIVGTDGPGGFAHGLKMKSDLLALEGFSEGLNPISGSRGGRRGIFR